MEKERYILNEEDMKTLENLKEKLTAGIRELKERNVRSVNIKIELQEHIKDTLLMIDEED